MKLGIDLGTTRSAIAMVEADDPTLLHNNAGDRLTPSVVYFGDDEVLVGKPAVGKEKSEDERIVRNAKRQMGEDHTFDIESEEYTPPEVSAEILKQLESDAADLIEEDISGAIITVPAYFTVDQKADTRKAAELAGFEDVELLHEPTAAAIAYGFNDEMSETLFVYDFGGGTLDISVMEVEGNSFDIIATGGDTELGGADFTRAVMDLLADEYEEQHGTDIREDNETWSNLRANAEEAKIGLSSREQVEINAPLMGQIGGETIGISERAITREEFEDISADLLDRAIDPIHEALDKADLETDDVDRVLLVGGSSKIPAVQERLEDEFGFEPTKTNDLDRLVAQGAAIVAGLDEGIEGNYLCPVCGQGFEVFDDFNTHLSKAHDASDSAAECPYCDEALADEEERRAHIGTEHPDELEDGKVEITKNKILSRSLGTDLQGGRMDILIGQGTELPTEETATYVPTDADAEKIPVHVYQGEDTENLHANEKLKDWYVEDIPSVEGKPTIEVTFEIDDDGILHVSAELEGGKSADTKLDMSGGGASQSGKAGADD